MTVDCQHLREQCRVILGILDEVDKEGLEGYTYIDPDHSLYERLVHAVHALAQGVPTALPSDLP